MNSIVNRSLRKGRKAAKTVFGIKQKPKIVIIGGGFAGLSAAQRLNASQFDVSLIDPEPHLEWLPNIHELISGVKKPDELIISRSGVLRRQGHRFYLAKATEMSSNQVYLDSGLKVPFDVCIVATGSSDSANLVDGARQFALPMKRVDQCEEIARRLRRASYSHRTTRVSVVGAGVEGIEAFGEVMRRYRRRPQFEINIVDSSNRLLVNSPGDLDRTIRRHTRDFRVNYNLGQRVESIEPDCIQLVNGNRIKSDITIWSGGIVPNEFLHRSCLTAEDNEWAKVNRYFQSETRENVFVVGDAANPDGLNLSKQAYHAMDMGRCAAQNVERLLTGKPLKAYSPAEKPQVVTFGDLDTFMLFKDFALSSTILGAAKEATYTLGLLQMVPPKSPRELVHNIDLLQRSVRKVYLPTLNPLNLISKLPSSKMMSD